MCVCVSAEGRTSVVLPEGPEQFVSNLLLNDKTAVLIAAACLSH